MTGFHNGLSAIAGMIIVKAEDYSFGLNGLPKSNVLKYFYEGTDVADSVVIRTSGTEPKLKAYISVTAEKKQTAEEIENKIRAALAARMN